MFDVVVRLAAELQAEQVLDLQGSDDNANAGGKAQRNRVGDKFDQPPGAHQAERNQNQPGQQRAQQQAAEAELLSDRQQNHHKGGGWPGDVKARTTKQSDQRAGHQHRIQAVLWCHADGNCQGHGQRNGNDAHRNAGAQVAAQVFPAIAGAQSLAPGGEQRR